MTDDLRFALRMLRKTPSVTAVAVLTLAVAIGATTSIFSAVSAMLLRPLPFPHPDELVALQDVEPGQQDHGFSWPEFVDVRAQAPDLAGLAAYRQENFNLSGRGEPLSADSVLVSQGYFDVLGVRPVAGRLFSPEDHVPNAAPVAVVSEGFWRRVLGSMAPGGTLLLDGVPYTLAGVAPQAAGTVAPADVYATLERKLPWTERGMHYLETVGRLKAGVGPARARANLAIAAPRIAAAAKATHLASLQPLQEYLRGGAAPLLLLLLAAVGLVLLIAAVNLANVVLSKSTGRVREFAVRRALGASGLRLARQLLVENAVVGLAGGGLGVLFALWGRDLVVRVWPTSLPPLDSAPLDLRVLAFAAAVALFAGLGIGLVPALQAARGDLQAGLKEGAGASARSRASGALVVAQSALAVLLLVGAVLVLQSFSRMLRESPGFRTDHALSVRVALPKARYPKPEQCAAFFRDLLERVSALPGVRAAGAAWRVPLGGGSMNGDFTIVGRPAPDEKDLPYAEKRIVSSGYFAAMQIPIVAGRAFDETAKADEIVINQALAKKIFPGEDPLGKRLAEGFSQEGSAVIVGVAADVKQKRLDRPVDSEIYYAQGKVRLRRDGRDRAHAGRSGGALAGGEGAGGDPRPRPPADEDPHAGGGDRAQRRAAAARRGAALGVRGGGALARGARHLRRRLLRGRPARARDRRADGARRAEGRRAADGAARGPAASRSSACSGAWSPRSASPGSCRASSTASRRAIRSPTWSSPRGCSSPPPRRPSCPRAAPPAWTRPSR